MSNRFVGNRSSDENPGLQLAKQVSDLQKNYRTITGFFQSHEHGHSDEHDLNQDSTNEQKLGS